MMSLDKWLVEGRLREHQSSRQEIKDLFRVVDRDLVDARIEALSVDRRYATSYNASLQLATIALRVSGYRTSGMGHHWVTFQALPLVMGPAEQNRADYFDACRRKRNMADYDAAGEIAESEATELYLEALEFRRHMLTWLRTEYPEFVPEEVDD